MSVIPQINTFKCLSLSFFLASFYCMQYWYTSVYVVFKYFDTFF